MDLTGFTSACVPRGGTSGPSSEVPQHLSKSRVPSTLTEYMRLRVVCHEILISGIHVFLFCTLHTHTCKGDSPRLRPSRKEGVWTGSE